MDAPIRLETGKRYLFVNQRNGEGIFEADYIETQLGFGQIVLFFKRGNMIFSLGQKQIAHLEIEPVYAVDYFN